MEAAAWAAAWPAAGKAHRLHRGPGPRPASVVQVLPAMVVLHWEIHVVPAWEVLVLYWPLAVPAAAALVLVVLAPVAAVVVVVSARVALGPWVSMAGTPAAAC